MTETKIEFRRCPACGRTEIVRTGEAVAGGRRHDRCDRPPDEWVHFTAPPDWRPLVAAAD